MTQDEILSGLLASRRFAVAARAGGSERAHAVVSIFRCRSRSAPVTHQVQGLREFSKEIVFSTPGIVVPQKRYHAVSKVIGSQIAWLVLVVSNPSVAKPWAYHLIKSSELSSF